ncbi:DNA-binding protein [Pseudomonas sp. GD03858]|uniref:DNA-binding protein n=1 Tax=unclassified Pseudomonas TaxID=196821 RepID=UPI00244BAD8D|nr:MULTISPECIES: DNA-binding protein [unclassified Pseudomonas]MDH0648068.1 DNA-binding protein [Pseudomonas sp. GD03867]MDH0663713.1 DNA-binding protein [Pseudomonas sp. GD03858]
MHANYAPEQACQAARQRPEIQGISVMDFAKKNGLHPSTVYAVLNGQKKCLRGEAHRAAVLLGIKEGTVAR